MILVFDNYDSFTYNLCDYIQQCGNEILVVRNDEMTIEEIEKLDFSGIILSPGPGIPSESGILMPLIHTFHKRVPILGICLGHQAIACYFEESLVKAPFPMHGKVSRIKMIPHPMWNGLPENISVCRYHSLVIDRLTKSELIVTAYSLDDSQIMALSHTNLPIWGIQFHPEAILTEYGMDIINNWLKAFNLHKEFKS
ncbi:MAG: aminodeoxychorismate/anthranilate synthase component II [Flavobacteriales bacterium]|nr:aminodeoxychorismate/anthranilate synthase component II [Flavobacteriales bacterium]